MKVLFFSHQSDYFFGGETCTLALMKNMNTLGVNMIFSSPEGYYARRVQNQGVKYMKIESEDFNIGQKAKFPPLLVYLRCFFSFIKIIKKERISILHATSDKALVYVWLLPLFIDIKLVWHHHNIDRFSIIKRLFFRLAKRTVTSIFVPSKATKQSLLRFGIPSDQIKVLYNGLDIDSWKANIIGNDDHLRLAYIGQISARKGVSIFPSILRQLNDAGIRWKMKIVGDVIDDAEFREDFYESMGEFVDKGKVQMTGYLDHDPSIYRGLDVLLVPSLSDPLPTVIIEAALSGMVVLASGVDGIVEMITDKETGFICNSPGDYAERLVKLALDMNSLKRIGKAARLNAEKKFNIDEMSKNVLSYYHAL